MLGRVTLDRLGPWRLWLVRHLWGVAYLTNLVVIINVVVAVGAWRRGLDGVLVASVGLSIGLVGSLLLLVAMSRRWRARAAAERRQRIGPQRDPGTSPVPWISTETWRREQALDPDLELLSGVQEMTSCVDQPNVYVADSHDRALAPIVECLREAPAVEIKVVVA